MIRFVPRLLCSWRKNSSTHWLWALVGPIAGLDIVAKRKALLKALNTASHDIVYIVIKYAAVSCTSITVLHADPEKLSVVLELQFISRRGLMTFIFRPVVSYFTLQLILKWICVRSFIYTVSYNVLHRSTLSRWGLCPRLKTLKQFQRVAVDLYAVHLSVVDTSVGHYVIPRTENIKSTSKVTVQMTSAYCILCIMQTVF
jgi:hypothetical protein